MTGRSRTRRYLLTQQGYYPGVVAKNFDVWDWSALNEGTMFQDSAKTTPVTANAQPVGAWVDGVGGVDAIQATTANKPTYTTASLNGLPTLGFDNGDVLATANISISTFAVWAVVKSSATNDVIYEHSVNTDTNNGMLLFSSQTASFRVNRSLLAIKNSSAIVADATYKMIRTEHNGTYSSFNVYFNNTLVSTVNTANDVGTGTATQPLYIGARAGTGLYLTGNIAHLCIVSPYPTDTSIITNMESYINGLWGVY